MLEEEKLLDETGDTLLTIIDDVGWVEAGLHGSCYLNGYADADVD